MEDIDSEHADQDDPEWGEFGEILYHVLDGPEGSVPGEQAGGGDGLHRLDLGAAGFCLHHGLFRRPVTNICNLGEDQDNEGPNDEEGHGMRQAVAHPLDQVEPA